MCAQFLLVMGQDGETWGHRLTRTDAHACLAVYLSELIILILA